MTKKEARPKGPGDSLLAAAQYIQKTSKNNGLFEVWLAEFGGKRSLSALQNCHERGPRTALRISITPANPTRRPKSTSTTRVGSLLLSASAPTPNRMAHSPGNNRISPKITMMAVAQPWRCGGSGRPGGGGGGESGAVLMVRACGSPTRSRQRRRSRPARGRGRIGDPPRF
jgi:hypothetical protein